MTPSLDAAASSGRRARAGLVLALGCVLALLLPPAEALAECCAPPPPATASTCPPQHVRPADFSDLSVTPDPVAVSCLVEYGVVRGTSDGRFDPGAPVTRAQMARFIFRLGEAASMRWRTSVVRPRFSDVDERSSPELSAALSGLVQGEVLQGFSDGTFRGEQAVTRGQTASMLQRFQVHYSSYVRGFYAVYPETTDPFRDDDGSVHENAIGALASTGITGGVAPGRFAPDAPVTRASMSRLLVRALAYEQGESDGRTPGDGSVRPWYPAAGDTLSDGARSGPFAPHQVAEGAQASWTFAGLDPDRDVLLVLAEGRTVVRTAGSLAFATSRQQPGVADLGEVSAVVTSVNDEALAVPARQLRVRPDAFGVLRVQARSDRDEAVVPVLHRGGPTAELDVEPPVEDPRAQSYAVRAIDAVAVSGPAEFVVDEAPDTTATLTTVVDGVRPTPDAFSALTPAGLRRFSYDNRDTFLSQDGSPIGLDSFEFRLGVPPLDGPGCDDEVQLEIDHVADNSAPGRFRLLPDPDCRPTVTPVS